MLGGDKHHAQAFARWIVDFEGRSLDNDLEAAYRFPNRQVILGEHHKMTHGEVKVNLRESMEYLTSEVDRADVVKLDFVMQQYDQIELLASFKEPIDLLDGDVPAELKPLSDAIWSQIAIHAIHQQRCENFVQLAGLIALTKVGEARRSCRAIIIAAIIRRFNQWGLEHRNQELKSDGKPAIKRLQGSVKTRLFLDYLDQFMESAEDARVELGEDAWKKIYRRLATTEMKASKRERDRALEKFQRDLRQQRKEVAAELPTGIDKTARVGGGIILRILTKTNGFEEHVVSEMRARKLPMTRKQKDSWTLAEKRSKIRQDEYGRRCTRDPDFSRENIVTDIKYILPRCRMLKSIETFEKQQKILDKEAGITALELGE